MTAAPQYLEDDRDLCIILGGHWGRALSYLLNLSPQFRRTYRTKVIVSASPGAPAKDAVTSDDVAFCRLVLFAAPGSGFWGLEPGYGELLASFPASTSRIAFALPPAPALWPLQCRSDGRNRPGLCEREVTFGPRYPYGFEHPCGGAVGSHASSGPDGIPIFYPYGDVYVKSMIRSGVSKRDIMRRYLALDVAAEADVDRILSRSYETLAAQERSTDVKVAEIIFERFRAERFHLAPDRPANRLSIIVANQALAVLGYPDLGTYPAQALSELLHPPEIPIHPSVARHFGLSYAGEGTRFAVDEIRYLTFEEYLDQYIDFVAAPVLDEELEVGRVRLELYNERVADMQHLERVLAESRSRLLSTIGRKVPAVTAADELVAVAARAAAPGALPDAELDGPFPGWSEGPVQHPAGWMLFMAVNVFRNGRVIGHIATTLVTGRVATAVSVRSPFQVPPSWQPVAAEPTVHR